MNSPIKTLLLLAACAVLAVSAHAEDFRGKVLKANGDVYIINASGEKHTVKESRFLVREMETIETAAGGNAVVRFNDGSMSVLNEESSLLVEKTNWLSHIGGRIYFTFRKVFGKEPRRVKTSTATLGVRGTTFIVIDDETGQAVALEEGVLDVESPDTEFEIHRQKEMDEFEAFKREMDERRQAMKREFDDYKKQVTREFVEYKKQFRLEANHVIRFDGKRVDETLLDEELKAEFDNFEELAGELLKEFREQTGQAETE